MSDLAISTSFFYEYSFYLLKGADRHGEKTRIFFAKQTNVQMLVDLTGLKVFESATVDINILLAAKTQKSVSKQKILSCIIKEDFEKSKNNMTDYVRHSANPASFPAGGKNWIILNPIEKRIKEKTLGHHLLNILATSSSKSSLR